MFLVSEVTSIFSKLKTHGGDFLMKDWAQVLETIQVENQSIPQLLRFVETCLGAAMVIDCATFRLCLTELQPGWIDLQ